MAGRFDAIETGGLGGLKLFEGGFARRGSLPNALFQAVPNHHLGK
jgi:hypothetical protein